MTWLWIFAVGCWVVAASAGWQLVHGRHPVARMQAEYAQALDAVRDHEAQLGMLATLSLGPSLQTVDSAFRAVRRTIAQLQAADVEATLYTAAPTTLSGHGMTVPAIPCRLLLRAETLFAVLEAVQAVERHQIVTQQWRLLPGHESELRFSVVGVEGTETKPRLPAMEPQEVT